jgi:hypothetical protein
VLRDPAARAALVQALDGVNRLVLLGDVLELRHGPARDALAAAAAPLREIGAALGADGEVVITAGNHDHHLVEDWTERRALVATPQPLATESAVERRPGDLLDAVAELLSPARVRAAYPGIWLREDVYATHGHYIDLHLTVPTIERLGAAAMGRVVGLGPSGPQGAEDYELVLAPIYAWIHSVAQWASPARSAILHGGSVRGWEALTGSWRGRSARQHAMAASFPILVAALNRLGLGPVRPHISGPELRRAGLAAMGEVASRLGVTGGWVIFGHTHRAGPLAADDAAQWRTPAGVALINSGSWVHEAAFVGSDPLQSPYRPGFAVRVEETDPATAPRLVNLLDGGERIRVPL